MRLPDQTNRGNFSHKKATADSLIKCITSLLPGLLAWSSFAQLFWYGEHLK